MEMKFQRIVWNKLVNKHSLVPADTISNQGNKMPMMDTANDLNLSLKFTLPLTTPSFQLLNGNHFPVRKDTFVDITEAALPKEIIPGETTRCPH